MKPIRFGAWVLLAALLIAATLWGRAASADPVYQSQTVACTHSAIYDASTNGATRLVTGNATQQIYVCGFALVGGGTAAVKLMYGTGGTCGSGTTAITPAFNLIAQTVVVDHQTYYAGLLPAPASNDLCLNASAGVAVQAIVYYAQF